MTHTSDITPRGILPLPPTPLAQSTNNPRQSAPTLIPISLLLLPLLIKRPLVPSLITNLPLPTPFIAILLLLWPQNIP